MMCNAKRLGPPLLCVDGNLLISAGIKYDVTRDRSSCMHARDGKSVPGGRRRTGVINLRGSADRPRCAPGGRYVDSQGSPAVPTCSRRGASATSLQGVRCKAVRKLPHAAFSTLDGRGARIALGNGRGRQGGQKALRLCGRDSHVTGSLLRCRHCQAPVPIALPPRCTSRTLPKSRAYRPVLASPPAARPTEAAGA